MERAKLPMPADSPSPGYRVRKGTVRFPPGWAVRRFHSVAGDRGAIPDQGCRSQRSQRRPPVRAGSG